MKDNETKTVTGTAYERVDLDKLPSTIAPESALAGDGTGKVDPDSYRFRWTVLPISIVLCVAQSVIVLLASNVNSVNLMATLIPVLAFALLVPTVLIVNPLLRVMFRNRIFRPLSRVELMAIFTAMFVTSGIATFGLAEQLVPIIGAPLNPEWNTVQRGWKDKVEPNLNRNLYLQDADAIRKFRDGITRTLDGKPIPRPLETAPFGEKWRYWQVVFFNIPWIHWIKPLAAWGVFIGAWYVVFYSLSYIVLQYWSSREKIIFPLAKLPEALLPDADKPQGFVPTMLRTPGFWWGFAISFCVLSYNAAVSAGWITGLNPIPLGMGAGEFDLVTKDSLFAGLGGKGAQHAMGFAIIFTAIGIAFLLPVEISFSTWFYFLVAKFILLAMVWMGYGTNTKDFPSDWLWQNNAISALGGGGMLLFSSVSLWRCIAEYIRMVRGKSTGEKIRVGIPVVCFVAGLVVILAWLHWNKLPLIWAFLFLAFLTFLTLGLMRIVAEAGIYFFQSHVSFFHLFKLTGLGKWMSPVLLVPLLPMAWVLFLDFKTFIAPNLLNAAKMQEDVGGSRKRFHINLLICLVVTVIVAVGFAIVLAHVRGATQMGGGWFFTQGPQAVFDTAVRATDTPPEMQPTTMGWYGIGAGWVGLSMFLRQTLFWFPHPIGFIMLINPLMAVLWFSFFIGWIFKRIVVRYGGKATFDKTKVIFIGLIMGELLAIVIWALLSIAFDFRVSLTLNRFIS